MNSPSDDIATILEDAGIGTKGTDLFSGSLPDTKMVLVIGVIDTGGFDTEYNTSIGKPTVQIRVRGAKFNDVYTKVAEIVAEISQAVDVTIDTTRYIHILETSQPINLGLDDSNRWNYTLNFRMERTTTV